MEQVIQNILSSPSIVSSDVLLQLGIFQIKDGDYANGEESLREVIMHSPRNAEAWLWMAHVAMQRQQTRTAERCLLQAFRCGHPDALRELSALDAQAEAERATRRTMTAKTGFSIENWFMEAVLFKRARLIAVGGVLLIAAVIVAALL